MSKAMIAGLFLLGAVAMVTLATQIANVFMAIPGLPEMIARILGY